MIVMGSPGSILRAPGSMTSLTQRPSGGQACRDRRKGWLGLWHESQGNVLGTEERLFMHPSSKPLPGVSCVLGQSGMVPVSRL